MTTINFIKRVCYSVIQHTRARARKACVKSEIDRVDYQGTNYDGKPSRSASVHVIVGRGEGHMRARSLINFN